MISLEFLGAGFLSFVVFIVDSWPLIPVLCVVGLLLIGFGLFLTLWRLRYE